MDVSVDASPLVVYQQKLHTSGPFLECTFCGVLALEGFVGCFRGAPMVMCRRSDWRHIGTVWPSEPEWKRRQNETTSMLTQQV